MNINYENILYPEEAVDAYKENLIDIYIESYGEEYTDLIRERIDNIFYFFDANPIDTFDVLYEYAKRDLVLSKRMTDEAEDYNKCNDMAMEKYGKPHIELLGKAFNTKKEIPELLDLDLSFLVDSSLSEFEHDVCFRQYEEYCDNLGVEPIYDSFVIDCLLDSEQTLYRYVDLYLLENSLWGKRIMNKFKDNFEDSSIFDVLNNIVLDPDTPGQTTQEFIGNSIELKTVIIFPLIDFLFSNGDCSIDHVFFHEMRHAIEFKDGNCGISSNSRESAYNFINEIHTEDNAVRDSKKLKGKVIWKQGELDFVTYQRVFPFVLDFFDKHRDFINHFSINNDIESFEEMFGATNLDELDSFISKILEIKEDFPDDDVEVKKYLNNGVTYSKSLIKRLNDNANKYFRIR